VSPSILREFQYLPVLAEGESPSQGGGGQPVIYRGLKLGISSGRDTYFACFEDFFVVDRNRMRGDYCIPFPGNELLRAVLDFETPSLSLSILILQLAPTGS